MKFPVLLLVFLFTTSFLSSCNKETVDEKGPLTVKFYNETGYKITNLQIGDRSLGTLNKDNSTSYIRFDQFGFDTRMPDEYCVGETSLGTAESYNQFFWCGTEKESVSSGKYEMTINLVDMDSVTYFRLDMR